jgi:hypothetical protein
MNILYVLFYMIAMCFSAYFVGRHYWRIPDGAEPLCVLFPFIIPIVFCFILGEKRREQRNSRSYKEVTDDD